MKTPNKFRDNLKQRIITEEMLEAALYSVNKRAKNYRDTARESSFRYGRFHRYTDSAEAKRDEYYGKKEILLSIVKPICIHEEHIGFQKERIYDYQGGYVNSVFTATMENRLIKFGEYFDWRIDSEVEFFDYETDEEKISYYLYYSVGGHTFHQPIDNPDNFPSLEIKKINQIITDGHEYLDLISVQFVDSLISLIKSGDYQLIPDTEKEMPVFPEYEEEKRDFSLNLKDAWYLLEPVFIDLVKSQRYPDSFFEAHTEYHDKTFGFRQNKKKGDYKPPKFNQVEPKLKISRDEIGSQAQLDCYVPGMNRMDYAKALTNETGPLHQWFEQIAEDYWLRKHFQEKYKEKIMEIYKHNPGKKIEIEK